MKRIAAIFVLGLAIFPGIMYAQDAEVDFGWFESLIGGLGDLINFTIPVLIAMALLLFIWGLIKFVFAGGDDDSRNEGKKLMIWGVITLFVIVSVWGIVALLNQITGVDQGETFDPVETGL